MKKHTLSFMASHLSNHMKKSFQTFYNLQSISAQYTTYVHTHKGVQTNPLTYPAYTAYTGNAGNG